MKQITTSEGKTYGFVEVPKEARNFGITWNNNKTKGGIEYNWQHPEVKDYRYMFPEYQDLTIIGTIQSKDGEIVCSFDPGVIVEKYDELEYKNYTPEKAFTSFAKDSLVSLLASIDIHLVNSMGEEPEHSQFVPAYLNDNFNRKNKQEEYEMTLEAWNEAEQKVIKGMLVCLEIKK